jgi:hypothetical protein
MLAMAAGVRKETTLPIAPHSYSGSAHLLPSVQNSGHPIWQTECTDLRDTRDSGMGSALTIAAHIHADLVQGNVSAWHHSPAQRSVRAGAPEANSYQLPMS